MRLSCGHSSAPRTGLAANTACRAATVQHSRRAPARSPWYASSSARPAAAWWPCSITSFTPLPRGWVPVRHRGQSTARPLSGRRWSMPLPGIANLPEPQRDLSRRCHRSIGAPRSGWQGRGGCQTYGSFCSFNLSWDRFRERKPALRSRGSGGNVETPMISMTYEVEMGWKRETGGNGKIVVYI